MRQSANAPPPDELRPHHQPPPSNQSITSTPKLTTNDTPKRVTTPEAPLSLDPARIWAFAQHTSWVEGRGEGGNLDDAYKKGTAPSGVAAVVASTVGLGFLRSHLPPPAAKQVRRQRPPNAIGGSPG